MADLAKRFPENPLLSPADLQPSKTGLHIACILNPGVFLYNGKIWMIVRVAERPLQSEVHLSFPVLKPDGTTEIREIMLDDPDLIATDTRVIQYKGADYLTTLSHLRLLYSADGVHFSEHPDYPALYGLGPMETYGIEDCRVTQLEERYYLAYTAVSADGVGVGLRSTVDWQHFDHHGMILPPHNKDCALFPEKIRGKYFAFHRPSSVQLGGNYIWITSSSDGTNWGNHTCIIRTRPAQWDNVRVGAGAAPIKTPKGWLAIYHGADQQHRYCLGAFLLDLEDPTIVLARTKDPIMEPTAAYETSGFFGHVVFTNGHIVQGDQVTVYYGAADEFVCGAHFSIEAILGAMQEV